MGPSTPTTKAKPIILIGGGTFGTSTAYHLAIVRTEYPSPLCTELASDARNIWCDPQGWIIGATERSLPFIPTSMESAKALGVDPPRLVSPDEIHKMWPVMNGSFEGWKAAGEGILRMANGAMRAGGAGVRYVSGDAGWEAHFADEVILAAGAAAGTLLDREGQIVAKGHAVGHIQLTPSEVERYKGLPVLEHLEEGILFPPQEDGIMKIGAVYFVTNYAKSFKGVSLPRYRSDNPKGGIPAPVEARLRKWMETCVPELAHRGGAHGVGLNDGDMADYHFLITPHPAHKNLKLAIGGSAHGFKFLPLLGKYIVEMMEGTLEVEAWP
ncbi:FAD dependent oxidoreductase [Aspergillus undulatus]|uniref:FAD dependent oxidoreductase n=1 Tax=Aspergillus undulatus TaxID=1810928 RepID=UPI003CCE2E6E